MFAVQGLKIYSPRKLTFGTDLGPAYWSKWVPQTHPPETKFDPSARDPFGRSPQHIPLGAGISPDGFSIAPHSSLKNSYFCSFWSRQLFFHIPLAHPSRPTSADKVFDLDF